MSRARDLSRLSSPQVFSVDATDASNNKIGVGTITPEGKLDVQGALNVQGGNFNVGTSATVYSDGNAIVGILTASAYYGDGSNLEGVASAGLGTAISDTTPGDAIYYTNTTLDINSNVTVDHPNTANASYTQYQEIAVADGIDFIVADGDEFIPDVLGLSTVGVTPLTGAGGRIRADLFTNKAGTGAPTFQTGVVITGVATATTFSGNVSGTTGTFTGNVSIGGTLTYEDVTNVDSVGVITARQGIRVGAGQSIGSTTSTENVVYYGDGSKLTNLPASGDSNDITACLFI